MSIEIVIPRATVNDESVSIASLFIEHGSRVAEGQVIAEIETSKANIEVEAGSGGFVEWLFSVGDEVPATACIGKIYQEVLNVPSDSRRLKEPRKTEFPVQGHYRDGADVGLFASSDILGEGFPLFSKAANFADRFYEEGNRSGEHLESTKSNGIDYNLRTKTAERKTTDPTPPFSSFVENVRCDLYRYAGKLGWRAFLSTIRYEPGFAATLNYRIGVSAQKAPLTRMLVFPLCQFYYRWICRRRGISIPFGAQIGPGLNFPHWGGIWINPKAILGANVTIGNNVNVGSAGPNPQGHPSIGDRVYLSPGVRVTGPIKIGADVLMTANALVTTDVPDGAILVGVPAEVRGYQKHNEFITKIAPRTGEHPD